MFGGMWVGRVSRDDRGGRLVEARVGSANRQAPRPRRPLKHRAPAPREPAGEFLRIAKQARVSPPPRVEDGQLDIVHRADIVRLMLGYPKTNRLGEVRFLFGLCDVGR